MASIKNKNVLIRIIAFLEALLILAMLAVIVWLLFVHRRDTRTITASEEAVVRTRPVIEKEETFYQYNGQKILMHDSSLGEVFVPVYGDVPASEINTDNIISRNGYSFYQENGEITSFAGIDISEHQGDIDWQQVKDSGIDFAMIRVGYRSYGEGVVNFDTNFRDNIRQANDVGIDVGVYFFSQATSQDEAIEEADRVLDAIEGCDITYPVVYDWEMIYDDSARTDDISVETLADCCVAFCERIKSGGYTPMIYQNKSTSMHKLDLPRVKDYDFWLAEYGDKPTYYYKYDMWQYTSTGSVPGITGDVDLNICFKDYGNSAE
ncbi:MAG: glycoside hydrolase family 25 protein [Ruminococcus sp.]|nr:glycoside hydrolase family 25 protein [Ruminococcus sp.]